MLEICVQMPVAQGRELMQLDCVAGVGDASKSGHGFQTYPAKTPHVD